MASKIELTLDCEGKWPELREPLRQVQEAKEIKIGTTTRLGGEPMVALRLDADSRSTVLGYVSLKAIRTIMAAVEQRYGGAPAAEIHGG